MKLSQLLATLLLLGGASLAQAQYMWIDEKGLKQLSDRPPPPSVPLKNILKQPGGIPNQLVPVDKPAPTPAPAAPAKPAVADPNAEFKKRVREQQEKDDKARAAEQSKLAKKTHCEEIRQQKQILESGARIGTVEKNGERGYMSDEQRAKEIDRANQAAASSCD
jgi:hypothetical protein